MEKCAKITNLSKAKVDELLAAVKFGTIVVKNEHSSPVYVEISHKFKYDKEIDEYLSRN